MSAAMRLEDCYRLLEVDRTATDEEVRNAWRDLSKVWHPDRFAHDPAMQRKAQEKLKSVNEAYEAIRAARAGTWRGDRGRAAESHAADAPWRVRMQGRQLGFESLAQIAMYVERGAIREPAEVMEASKGTWMALNAVPELRQALGRRRVRRYRSWGFACIAAALFLLVRRPTPGGLIIAAILFVAAFILISRMRET
jgi:curved DNA-binding protein CbpA